MSKLSDFDAADKASRFGANRLLFGWLSDDEKRAQLYAELRGAKEPPLKFQSRADEKAHSWHDADPKFQQEVYLLAKRADILDALKGNGYSNAPYQMLGSGTFMLGLDPKQAKIQRDFAGAYLDTANPRFEEHVRILASLAFLAGAVLPLKQRNFDLTDLAEQVAIRFTGFLFGFEQGDQYLIERTMRRAYHGLNFVILGRHFVSEPGMIDMASRDMGELLIRVAALIDLYGARIGRDQQDLYERIQLEQKDLQAFTEKNGNKPLADFKPILQRIAEREGKDDATQKCSTSELAVIVVGLMAGMIGNVQASVCATINELFDPRHRKAGILEKARELARESVLNDRHYKNPITELVRWTWEALRLNPPAAFLPRLTTEDGKPTPKGTVVILAMGSATREIGGELFRDNAPQQPDDLIFGDGGAHQCVGKYLAMPLVNLIVRNTLALPGLEQRLDPKTGEPFRLEKSWGFYCTRYPMEYDRYDVMKQSPLIVIMQVKKPLSVHAEALKAVIKYGAPRIEKKLRDSGHVHFASFVFLENDSKLALYTVYDRDFDAYIEYFALKIGPLFDKIFEHIEDAPPLPVDKFPKEFVDTIRRFNNRPAGDYFFSAYPAADVSMITHHWPSEGA